MKYESKKDWVLAAKKVHHNKYDYSKAEWDSCQKLEIVCREHGPFFKFPDIHVRLKQGCPECSGKRKLTTEKFIEKARARHGDLYDYSKSVYTKSHGKVEIICKEHGSFFQPAVWHYGSKGTGCPRCAPNYTKTTKGFIDECRKVHGNLFDYSKIKYTLAHHKIVVVCKKHGDFSILAYQHLQGQGCRKCAYEKRADKFSMTREEFLKRAKEAFGCDYSYQLPNFKRGNQRLKVKCREHGVFKTRTLTFLRSAGCPKCYPASPISKPQRKLQLFLEQKGLKVQSNYKMSNRKHIDIYLPEYKVGIEVNGIYWHSDKHRPELYHYKKSLQAKREGIQLLHFWDYEIQEKFDLVCSMIRAKIGKNKRIGARETYVKEISNAQANGFLEKSHLQGKCFAKVCLGLFMGDETLVSVMTFGKPRFNKKFEWELIRFASLPNYSVSGAASKLMHHFVIRYSPESMLSYANLRFSQGNLYKTLGFEYAGKSSPNYSYYKGSSVVSRYKAQKKKLPNLLTNFNKDLSEYENMLLNGYKRVYDCGNLIYTKEFEF